MGTTQTTIRNHQPILSRLNTLQDLPFQRPRQVVAKGFRLSQNNRFVFMQLQVSFQHYVLLQHQRLHTRTSLNHFLCKFPSDNESTHSSSSQQSSKCYVESFCYLKHGDILQEKRLMDVFLQLRRGKVRQRDTRSTINEFQIRQTSLATS